jgi:hypothetical protein
MLKQMSKLLTLLFVIGFTVIFTPKIGGQIAYGGANLEADIAAFTIRLVLLAGAALALVIATAMAFNKPSDTVKQLLFWSIVGIVCGVTTTLIITTVRLNKLSWSQGPVHWHADYQVWACGRELDLVDPQGKFSNKVGTATLHEHNDKRIHLEGVAVSPNSAMLGRFFQVVGGTITYDSFAFPTNSGVKTYRNGDFCNDTTPGLVQAFVYTVNDDKTFYQYKLDDPLSYIVRGESQVPPGDCIVLEFDVPKDRTDHMCKSFEVAQQIGKLKGELRDRN